MFYLSLVPKLFTSGGYGVWYVPAILLLYISFPYIHSFIYEPASGSDDAVIDKRNPEHRREWWIAFKTLALLVLALFWFWMFHKYNGALFDRLEILLGRVPAFIMGIYIGHLAYSKVRVPPALAVLIVGCAVVY